MSRILDFQRGKGTDDAGRTVHDIRRWGDEDWEKCHMHIQWCFPLPEASKMQPGSPVATREELTAIGKDFLAGSFLAMSVARYMDFLDRTEAWKRPRDHNHLRITRVIRCLCLCGFRELAEYFHQFVLERRGDAVCEESRWYWQEAFNDPPAWLQASLR